MARIRSMKPEMRTSDRVTSWPIPLRYFWALLWGYADDWGRARYNAKLIKADTFPLDDDITAATITEWMEQLAREGVIGFYSVNGTAYFFVTNWDEHQKISHPGKQSIPCPHGIIGPEKRGRCADHDETSNAPESVGGESPDTLRKVSGESPAKPSPKQGGGAGSREGEASTDGQPPAGCPNHPDNTDSPCLPCRTARQKRQEWDRAHLDHGKSRVPRPPTAAEALQQQCGTHPGYPAASCTRCDDDRVAS